MAKQIVGESKTLLVAGNWKMNGSTATASDFLESIVHHWNGSDRVDVGLFPPSVYVSQFEKTLRGSSIKVGGQNIATKLEGAFTGEVSSRMLKDLGCQMVLVGHSERRINFQEDDETIAAKYHLACAADLTPILCVGETSDHRDAGSTIDVISEQIDAVKSLVGEHDLCAGVIAYEPVWAIGSGVAASPTQAQEVHSSIRDLLGPNGKQTQIIYGGSLNRDNAQALFAEQDIDGGLVGGASLHAEHFLEIIRLAEYA